jgi:virulence-associated protein VagC
VCDFLSFAFLLYRRVHQEAQVATTLLSISNQGSNLLEELDMKKCGLMLSAGVLALLFVTTTAYAQGSEPPPPCCKDAQVVFDKDLLSTPVAEGQVDVSATTLQLLHSTRSQFVDRLAAGLFPGKRVELVLSSTRLVLNPTAGGNNRVRATDSGDEELVAVQEKRFYRMSRERVRSEDLDAIEQLYLTDGEVYIKVSFVRGQ